MALTEVKVRNAKTTEKQIKLFDSDGMFLLVTPTGGKRWRLKYRFGGKEKLLALGTYPEISLLEARKRRDQAREQVSIPVLHVKPKNRQSLLQVKLLKV